MEGVGTEYDETNARHVISSKSGEGYAIFGAGCRGVRVSFEVEVWSALFAGSEAFGDEPLSIIYSLQANLTMVHFWRRRISSNSLWLVTC